MTNTAAKRKHFHWGRLLLLVLVFSGIIRIGDQVIRYMDLQERATALEAELAAVEQEYQAKQSQIELLNDNAYIERLARERLGMVMEGEILVMAVNPEAEAVAAAPASEDVPIE
ncbi:MAG: septum formation initiator family protein [Bacillota bacterium]|nr:septum formation initiator family protein [Bacillota bacterium]